MTMYYLCVHEHACTCDMLMGWGTREHNALKLRMLLVPLKTPCVSHRAPWWPWPSTGSNHSCILELLLTQGLS